MGSDSDESPKIKGYKGMQMHHQSEVKQSMHKNQYDQNVDDP
jgi:hypothetical protein